MQISGQGGARDLANLLLGVQDADRTASKPPVVQEVRQQPEDQVQISEYAKEIQRLKALAQEDDPARAEKVAQIQQAIAGGTYNVSGRAVADALIRSTLTDTVV
jgi:negative regulator of flagellin synthesis FlgM